jgi:hypothetical protein
MSWFPVGPNFVFAPADTGFKRLSRRNEGGRQGKVSAITVDPTDASHVYIVVSPATGGAAAFHSADGGASWEAVSDALQQADPTVLSTAIAVNPVNPAIIYLATDDGRCFTSTSRGAAGSWSAAAALGGAVTRLLVDPNTAAAPATTVLYAAGSDGVWQSTDGGASFKQVVQAGNVQGFVGDFTTSGQPLLYAAVANTGVLFSDAPSTPSSWVNLNTLGIGLPGGTSSFDGILIDRCPANGRLYAVFADPSGGNWPDTEQLVGLYTSTAPQTAWTSIPLDSSHPNPQQGLYNFGFAVASNSDGDGANDILFFTGWKLFRSVDSGQTWTRLTDSGNFHDDYHVIAFAPATFNGGAVPNTFIGCDGGIARSDRFADPTFDFGQTFTDYDSEEDYSDTGGCENLNHGLQSSACLVYAAVRTSPALSYIGCQDTGLAGGAASLGWRNLQNDDVFQVGASPGPNGVSVWDDMDGQVYLFADQGGYENSPSTAVTMATAGGSPVSPTSNFTVGLDGLALAGLSVGQLQVVGRLDHAGGATQISQDFGSTPPVFVAASPVDPDQLYCVTSDGQLWHTASGSSASASTVWTAMPAGFSGYTISAISVDQADIVFVLMRTPVTVGGGEITTPLFRADAGSWAPITCTGLPAPGSSYGRIVADPHQAGTLYATYGGSVFQVAVSGNNAAWTSVSAGLPGGAIADLWAASVTDVRTGTNPITLLRAAVPTRGVWELAIPDPSSAEPLLYVRDNVADLGWIDTAPDPGPDPYSSGGQIWHYQCADIKVDALKPASGANPAFFQTDPENPLPISQVAFDVVRDNSQNLPSGDPAMVHVQVHNRSTGTATGVNVWAIACNASAGVPPLSTATFDFWSQFHSNGAIIPALPSGSPWTSVGTPVTIQPVDAYTPQVASWNWTAPTLGPGDVGHYCIMAFVHSADSPLSLSVSGGDAATVASVQVGQKNLHIGPPLPASPGPHGSGRGAPGGRPFTESVDFWNPTTAMRQATLVFDLRRLHPNILATLFFTKLDTTLPMPQAVTGYTKIVADPLQHAGHFGHLLEAALRAADRVEDRAEDAVRRFFGLGHEHDPDDMPTDLPPGFEPVGWIGQRSSVIEVRGVRIPPGERVRALLHLQTAGPLPPGAIYRAEVQQAVSGQLAGGSTFVVPVA